MRNMSKYERSRTRNAATILVLIMLLSRNSTLATIKQAGTTGPERTWIKLPVVSNKVSLACTPVPYARQKLDPDSYLGRRLDINYRVGLLKTFNVDDYLNSYGKRPQWPSGEYLGKFMQALSRMYLYTGDPVARERLDRIIRKWLAIQEEDGWLGTCDRFKSWDIWEHKYVLLGLVDYYALTGEEKALKAARKIGDLYCDTIGPGKGDINQSGHWAMGSESILEPMVYLYRYTGEPKYLRFCEYIMDAFESPTGPKLISIMTSGSRRVCDVEDPWANRPAREITFKSSAQIRNRSKGYEMLSCIIGLARMYQLTGKEQYLDVARNAWQDISQNRLYLCGSSGADECFKDDHCLPAETGDGPAEGCVTAHWIYLSRILFEMTGKTCYVDAVENALYNYLLASQRPQDCYQSYNTPMNGTKKFARHDPSGRVHGAPCCISSVMREIARTPEVLWTKFVTDGLGVLIYHQGTMEDIITTTDGQLLPVRLEMKADFPNSGVATIRIRVAHRGTFRLALRVPNWARSFRATVGGRTRTGTPGQFLNLERPWQDGDVVKVQMDMNARLVPGGASYPGSCAFMRGPQVLTLVTKRGGKQSLDRAAVKSHMDPILQPASDFLPPDWVGDQAYSTPALIRAKGCLLVPFADSGQPGLPGEFRTWIPADAGTVWAVPTAPAGLQATVLSPNRIQLAWADQSTDEVGFRIERKRTDVGVWFHVKTTPKDVTRCVDDSVNVVLPGKTYAYRVAAYGDDGISEFAGQATVTTPAVAIPTAPSELGVTAVSPTQIRLTWVDQSTTEDGFEVERRIESNTKWIQIAGRVPANRPAFTDYGLQSGQAYWYRTRAFNAGGESAWSNEVVARTNEP